MLQNFDVTTTQLAMLPLGRPVSRPLEQPGQARIASVLLLLYCHHSETHLVLTKRRDDLRSHGGQISFPGGRQDEGETLEETAVRETHEEIGIPPAEITIINRLTQIYIPPSDFEVHPFVGWIQHQERPAFSPSPDEVSEVITVPLGYLLNTDCRKSEKRTFRGTVYDVPYFAIGEHKVWGGTAVMLNEFIERLHFVKKLLSN